eukprot:1148924-Pelagomonas_calceolata.AAC.5
MPYQLPRIVTDKDSKPLRITLFGALGSLGMEVCFQALVLKRRKPPLRGTSLQEVCTQPFSGLS